MGKANKQHKIDLKDPETIAEYLRSKGIVNYLELAHMMAQIAHETGGFKWMAELGGDSYFSKYDGRKDLGNVYPGDGARYKGRGFFQLTGRANYDYYGKRLGIDLIGNPSLASKPEIAADIAIQYWKDRGIGKHARLDDIRAVTRRINGGYNGLADRKKWLAKFKEGYQ